MRIGQKDRPVASLDASHGGHGGHGGCLESVTRGLPPAFGLSQRRP